MARGSSLLAREAPRQGRFDIIVEDGFVLTELAAIVDVLRITNRVCQQEVFGWRFRSISGGAKRDSVGVTVDTAPLAERPSVEYAIMLGNADALAMAVPLRRVLSAYGARGARLFLLAEAASHYIRSHNKGAVHTTHWENRLAQSEEVDASDWGAELARDHDGITTCAGMGATVDLMLSVVAGHVSQAAMMNVSDILLHHHVRDMRTPQPFGSDQSSALGDPDLDACIALMKANLEEPLPIQDLCRLLNISNRSLERKFSRYLGLTPNSYYRELRLNKASALLLNTSLSIREVGLACGFSSSFAPLFKTVFGCTPAEARRRKRPTPAIAHSAG
jgi:transcriptional regulator GlxA family with amidase domain